MKRDDLVAAAIFTLCLLGCICAENIPLLLGLVGAAGLLTLGKEYI